MPEQLWTRDPRVSPGTGTAHGVLQAVNTYEHHEGVVRGADRAERNNLKTLTDGYPWKLPAKTPTHGSAHLGGLAKSRS